MTKLNGHWISAEQHEALRAADRKVVAERDAALAKLAECEKQEPVAAQVRFRRPEKGTPDWSPWQQSALLAEHPAWLIDGAGYEVEYRLIYAQPRPAAVDESTTGDKYRAELYDEVWQKARDMGFGNVTEALLKLERLNAAAQVPEAGGVAEGLRAAAAWHMTQCEAFDRQMHDDEAKYRRAIEAKLHQSRIEALLARWQSSSCSAANHRDYAAELTRQADAAPQPAAQQVPEDVRRLLERASTHLRLHAEEASHPGQYQLITEIDAALSAQSNEKEGAE